MSHTCTPRSHTIGYYEVKAYASVSYNVGQFACNEGAATRITYDDMTSRSYHTGLVNTLLAVEM